MVWELPTSRAPAYRQYHLPGERLWEGRAQEAEGEAQLEISWASENPPPQALIRWGTGEPSSGASTEASISSPRPHGRKRTPVKAEGRCLPLLGSDGALPAQVSASLPLKLFRPTSCRGFLHTLTHHPPLPAFRCWCTRLFNPRT